MELGSGEILLILVVALLIYGGRLPEVARAIGKSLAELKRGIMETKDAVAADFDPGIQIDADAARETRRIAPAPPHLAKEDISSPAPDPPPAAPATPEPAPSGEPGPWGDPRPPS
jgi:TatA/E family protein of Tat protein translocase